MKKERICRVLPVLLVIAVLTVTGTVYAQAAPVEVKLPFKAERPRLVFSKAQLPVIKARCEGGYKDEYKKMVAWADKEVESVLSGNFAKKFKTASELKRLFPREKSMWTLYGPRFQTFGLLWHLTGEKRYAEAGKRVMSLLFVPHQKGGYIIWQQARVMDSAAAYDLFYDVLSPEERNTYGRNLLGCISKRRGFQVRSYHGLAPPATVLIALYGTDIDPETVNRRLANAYDYANNFYLRSFALKSRNRGGWNEGIFCSCMGKPMHIPFWWRWRNATGEKIFETNPTFFGMGTWLVYNVMDLNQESLNEYIVPTPGGGYLTNFGVDTCSALADDGVGTWLTRWLRRHKWRRKKITEIPPELLWRKILLEDPALKVIEPAELPETTIFEGWGWVSMRSGWDAAAVFAHFSSGMKGQGEPAHLDNNRFVIYHKGFLAIDGIKPRATPKFPDTYDRMSLAHNTLTVYDPDEKIWGRGIYVYAHVHGKPFAVNDGGQTFRKDCFVKDIPHVRGPSKMVKQGDIIAYETSSAYDYVCGDATKSYSAHKMKYFTRQFVFLKPDVFVVFDRVVSTKKEYRKRWHLHFYEEPVIEGAVVHADYKGGRLWCETLLPEKATVRKVQGAQVEKVDGTYELPEVWKDYNSKTWRLDVGPTDSQTDDVFLHVLQAVDADKPRTFSATTIRKGDGIGVRLTRSGRTFEVLFAKTGNPAGHITISENGKQLVSRDLAEKVVDSYAQWKDDPRFRMWMTDEGFRYTVPKADRRRFGKR